MRFIFTIALIFAAISASARRPDGVWFGGGLGLSMPSNLGNKASTLGFSTVAVPGFQAQAEGRWFYASRLSLGGALSASFLAQNDDFWVLRNKGRVSASYTMLSAVAKGHYYFSDDAFRPFAGMAFGVGWLSNSLNYESSLSGTLVDNSIDYINRQFKPLFSPEVGFVMEASPKTFFYVTCAFVVLPDMRPEYVPVTDVYGYTADVVVQNPHGNQNHFNFTIGLLFKWD
ncbi:MAG: hypothetical protein JXR39_03335 [Marinilabiliaceae bacterium]|nr:hypothetical protein [Marinilabiliaceae bacterium]